MLATTGYGSVWHRSMLAVHQHQLLPHSLAWRAARMYRPMCDWHVAVQQAEGEKRVE